jgi:hypothetical protein
MALPIDQLAGCPHLIKDIQEHLPKDRTNKTAFWLRAVRQRGSRGSRSPGPDAKNVMQLTVHAAVVQRRADPSARRAVGSERRVNIPGQTRSARA